MNLYRHNPKVGDWELLPLGPSAEIGLDRRGRPIIGKRVDRHVCYLTEYDDSFHRPRCLLIAEPEAVVKINGRQAFPLQVLHDRDEIRFVGETVYFTDESPAEVVRFKSNDGDPPIFCARCKLALKGDAVRCPGNCGLWYHQNEDSSCWTYDRQCVVCQHPTGSGLSWKPAPRALRELTRRGLRDSG